MNTYSHSKFESVKNWHLPDPAAHLALVSEVCQAYTKGEYEVEPGLQDMISILAEAEADWEMAVVCVLRSMRCNPTVNSERIKKLFGLSICRLYEGTLQMVGISLKVGSGKVQQAHAQKYVDFSKILVAMVDDPRVVVIYLAECLIGVREGKHLEDAEKCKIANLATSVYVPLANKLGIWRLKWELEDLSFKYLNRPEYDRLARKLDERRVEREEFINEFVVEIQQLMKSSNIKAVVNGRAKHIVGIWKKLNRKGVDFERIFDVRAFRILVNDVASCYAALGAVHASWTAVSGEFDDYIAVPKPNGYQSLHTAVYGPASKIIEVQIRTFEMHEECEFGVAAHWKYKEDTKSSDYQDNKVKLLRQLLEWKEEISEEFTREHSQSVANQEIYVFTPAGNVIELPVCATPVDFAYAIHTEVGHRCRGALVNDKIVPLTHALKTGDWVEIRTVKSGGPSRDWLNVHLGFTVSSRARSCIRRWFKQKEHGRYHAQGKALLEKEFSKHGLTKVSLEKLAVENGFRQSQDLLVAIGMKEFKPFHAVSSLIEDSDSQNQTMDVDVKVSRSSEAAPPSLSILGVDNLLTVHAACCKPLPGDDVIGYVTAARGITIHKRGCGNVVRMLKLNPERLIEVQWEYDKNATYPVDLELIAEGHPSLLHDISAAIAEVGVNLTAVNTAPVRLQQLGKIYLTVEISNSKKLRKVMSKLRSVDFVLQVKRVTN